MGRWRTGGGPLVECADGSACAVGSPTRLRSGGHSTHARTAGLRSTSATGSGGRRSAPEIMLAPDVFGELVALDLADTYPGTATALQDSEGFILSSADLTSAFRQTPADIREVSADPGAGAAVLSPVPVQARQGHVGSPAQM